MKYAEYRSAIKLHSLHDESRITVRNHKMVAVASVLWNQEKEKVMTVWGAGTSRRSARRAAQHILKPLGRDFKTEETKYQDIPHRQKYRVWSEKQSEVKTHAHPK